MLTPQEQRFWQKLCALIADARDSAVAQIIEGHASPEQYKRLAGRISAFDDVITFAETVAAENEKD